MGGGGGGGSSLASQNPFQSFLGGGSANQVSPFGSDSGGTMGQISPFQSLLGGAMGQSSLSQSGGGEGASGGDSPSNDSGKTPTVQEFDSASKAPYGFPSQSDLKPLEVNGRPVEEKTQSGMVAEAFVTPHNQVILSFGGTGSGGGSGLAGQIQSDIVGGAGGVSGAQKDAADFTKQVQGIADKQGIGSQNVFVTGHSLGGMEAQYASAQTGAGGMSFEAPGSTAGSNPVGNGSNFVNVRDQSDPIANIGSHYGKTLSVNTGEGILAHLPGSQDRLLPLNETLAQLESGLAA